MSYFISETKSALNTFLIFGLLHVHRGGKIFGKFGEIPVPARKKRIWDLHWFCEFLHWEYCCLKIFGTAVFGRIFLWFFHLSHFEAFMFSIIAQGPSQGKACAKVPSNGRGSSWIAWTQKNTSESIMDGDWMVIGFFFAQQATNEVGTVSHLWYACTGKYHTLLYYVPGPSKRVLFWTLRGCLVSEAFRMEGLSSLCWVDLVDYQCLETTRFIPNIFFKIWHTLHQNLIL